MASRSKEGQGKLKNFFMEFPLLWTEEGVRMVKAAQSMAEAPQTQAVVQGN